MTLRALIVDDEPIARRGVARLLRDEKSIQVIGEASNGRLALEMILAERPDVVFLDIEMPEMNGIDVAAQLPRPMPLVVFLTAYDEYAVKAFELNAIDYVLKPIDPDRFAQTLSRIHRSRSSESSDVESRLRAVIDQLAHPGKYLERIPVKSGEKIVFVNVEEIRFTNAEDNYIRLHTKRGEFLIRDTVTAFEERLDPNRFVRIRRSTIVRIDAIREMHPLFNGAYEIVLDDSTRLTSSRRFREGIDRLLRA